MVSLSQTTQKSHRDHPNRLHPIGLVVDTMVTHRDGIVVSSGLKLVNSLIKCCETLGAAEQVCSILSVFLYLFRDKSFY